MKIWKLQRLLGEFLVFFHVKVDSIPEVDLWACPGAVRTRKSGHCSFEPYVDV